MRSIEPEMVAVRVVLNPSRWVRRLTRNAGLSHVIRISNRRARAVGVSFDFRANLDLRFLVDSPTNRLPRLQKTRRARIDRPWRKGVREIHRDPRALVSLICKADAFNVGTRRRCTKKAYPRSRIENASNRFICFPISASALFSSGAVKQLLG